MIPILALSIAPLFFAADLSAVKVTKLAAPQKALQFEVLVPAKLDDVWTAFTTSEGLETWLWSSCEVELRPGGGWTVNYPGGGTGGGTIVSIDAKREIVMRALAPPQFPTVRHDRLNADFKFEAEGNQTRVSLFQTGWKEGKEWDDAYEYLAQGNAQLLNQLRNRFLKGPVDWKAMK